MGTLKILQEGDGRLARMCADFRVPTAATVGPRYRTLAAAMEEAGLVGLAACQIGMRVRLLCARLTATSNAGVVLPPTCFSNPRLTWTSPETCEIYEGCGSVGAGGTFVPVVRPRAVALEALDEYARPFRVACDGALARIVQHEMDHLDGVLMTRRGDMARALPREQYLRRRGELRDRNPDWRVTRLDFERP